MGSLRTATKSSPHSPQLEKARAQQRRPNAAKKKKKEHTELEDPKRLGLARAEYELGHEKRRSRKAGRSQFIMGSHVKEPGSYLRTMVSHGQVYPHIQPCTLFLLPPPLRALG